MNRKEALDAAAACVLRDRNTSYGEPEDSFARIAAEWTLELSGTLRRPITALDVARMMARLKLARAAYNPTHGDNFVDAVGYLACAAELASKEAGE